MSSLDKIPEGKKKVLTNVLWAVSGKCVSLLSVLVVGIIVARYLGKELYGTMNYVISFVAIFQVFADFGLDFIQVREESKSPHLRDKIVGTTFLLKLLFASITLVAILVTTFLCESDGSTRLYILIYALSVLLNTTWVARNHFTSIVWNEYVVKTEITRTIVGVLIKVSFVQLHLPLIYFILSLVIDSLLLASGYILSYQRKIDTVKKWTFDRQTAKYMVQQSFPLLLSGAAIIVYNRIDQIMIGNMIDKSELGIYSVAVRFAELLVFVPTIISQTVSPVLVAAREESEEKYNRLSRVFMNVTVSICIIIGVATSLLAYPIVYVTFGPTYIAAASVLSVLGFKIVGDALSQTSGQMIIVEGKQKYASVRNLIGCAVCVGLNFVLIESYGIQGAAWVSIVTILTSGTLANLIIPSYRKIFRKQIQSIFFGWKDMLNLKTLLR
ncbi:MAG: flippase [Bacteroidales bacterium]|nr:flippase [Candidatus Physcousia equi]